MCERMNECCVKAPQVVGRLENIDHLIGFHSIRPMRSQKEWKHCSQILTASLQGISLLCPLCVLDLSKAFE